MIGKVRLGLERIGFRIIEKAVERPVLPQTVRDAAYALRNLTLNTLSITEILFLGMNLTEKMDNIRCLEKLRMLQGKHYHPSDPKLSRTRKRSRELVETYNKTREGQRAIRHLILKIILGKAGQNVDIRTPFRCDYGDNVYIGDRFYMNHNGIILSPNEVRIGDDVQCGPGVRILTATHPSDPDPRITGAEAAFPITIGNNVFIGADALILPGASIGNNSFIDAGSVVTRKFSAQKLPNGKTLADGNVKVGGHPCRFIREL